MTGRTRIALVFGGRSSEHSISCATAGGVLGAIDRDRFEVVPVGVTRDGAFVLERDDAAAFALDPERLPAVRDDGSRVFWPESATSRELTVRHADGSWASLGEVDVAFPILHGPFGEDGTIQGLFELIGMPYVGNGVLASALGMDKHYTKTVLAAAGVPVAPWVTVEAADRTADPAYLQRRIAALGYPAFVKPARAGSSVGVSKVATFDDVPAALDAAFAHDGRVLVERAMVGRELEIGVLGSPTGAARTSAVGEIVVTGRDFYDFDAKYLDAPGVDLVCPAPLGDGERMELERLAQRAFQAVDGRGLARVDVFLTGEGFVVNEINTMPGFTPISMFPRCWQQAGLAYPDLIAELIALAR